MGKTAIFSISLSLIIFSSLSSTAAEMYVSPTGTDTAICGTITAPCKTILQAFWHTSGSGTMVFKIAAGSYSESLSLSDTSDVTFQGGWNETFTSQTCDPEKTILSSPAATKGAPLTVSAISGKTLSVNLECLRLTTQVVTLHGILVSVQNSNSLVTLTMRHVIIDSFNKSGLKIIASDNGEIRAVIEDSSIHHNQQTTTLGIGGAGIYAGSVSGTIEFDLKRNRITDNISLSTGGGVLLQAEGNSIINARMENNIIADNQGSHGGGLYLAPNPGTINLEITNDTISNNVAEQNGGGLYLQSPSNTISALLRNVIIRGNSITCPTCKGPDIYLDVPPWPDDSSGINVDYSIIGDVSIQSSSNYVDGGHNLNKDPKLSADSMLLSGSPAINNGRCGNKLLVSSRIAPYDDIEGDRRPGFGQLTGCDIGADEYSSLNCFPVKNKQGGKSIICF